MTTPLTPKHIAALPEEWQRAARSTMTRLVAERLDDVSTLTVEVAEVHLADLYAALAEAREALRLFGVDTGEARDRLSEEAQDGK